MIEIVTYHSTNAKPEAAWTAFIVLPNGDYWGVRFSGATEEIAKAKAIRLWTSERERYGLNPEPTELKSCVNPWADLPSQPKPEKLTSGLGRGSHLRGKVWMRHKQSRDLIAVALTEITMYEQRGFERSGPRSK